jgi:hypothetical protein
VKLNEILKEAENPELLKWLKDWNVSAMFEGDGTRVTMDYKKLYEFFVNGKENFPKEYENCQIYVRFEFRNHEVTQCPGGAKLWYDFYGDKLAGTTYSYATVRDAKQLMDLGEEFTFAKCAIYDLKLDKDFYADSFQFYETTVYCGLLSLLKAEYVGKIKARYCVQHGLEKAVGIIDKHKGTDDTDIPECMDELIGAGLKEFAKL